MVVRCHLWHHQQLRACVLRPYNVLYGTINHCVYVFYGCTMSSTAPETAARTCSAAIRCHLWYGKPLHACVLRVCDVIYGTVNHCVQVFYGHTNRWVHVFYRCICQHGHTPNVLVGQSRIGKFLLVGQNVRCLPWSGRTYFTFGRTLSDVRPLF